MVTCSFFIVISSFIMLIGVCDGFGCSRISESHNIDECDVNKAYIPLLQTNVYEPARFLGIIRRTITYPPSMPDDKHQISCIKVTNLDTSDHGGYARIISGGVGSYDTQIFITSQFSQPINFRIEIWAET